ncbi:L-aspartate oxidase [Ancylobacter lacus]|uniref:L-aspartate oxidase n=1 Tax=Ancylobacter lacus TaxID=2579970 RepID=UPI001BCF803B|nr:L-aspartate oxidase [Ancylobacter lacus]MBS7539236.1 L-aspartate oxidase [Ancylobacter lacus]
MDRAEPGSARAPEHVIVVGGGIAGLATALRLAPMPVTLLCASPLGTGAATAWAQGGIAAAIGADDHPDLHAVDTLKAGAGLCDPLVARLVATGAAAAVDWLARLGTPFDREAGGALALGLEAAHSRRRIVHAGGDSTGRVVLESLIRAAAACGSITAQEGRLDGLLRDGAGRIAGITFRDRSGAAQALEARAVVLATGGIGGLYASTTNPLTAVGSGLAVAARAGAVLRDMEFVQFHPTAIAAGADPMPLATEALRGEGAQLFNDRGERFMRGVPGAELAPRDVVARAIFAEIAAGRRVVLDARMAGIETRFPGVVALCRANGIDPAQQPIPVRPAAHYHMGGLAVDTEGRTSLPGLWACGEVAATGLHGANRLASNSLLEALVFAERIAADILGEEAPALAQPAPAFAPARTAPELARLRPLMDRHVGVVREAAGLAEAVRVLQPLAQGGAEPVASLALVIAVAALRREESRGGHCRADHPATAPLAVSSRTDLAETLAFAEAFVEAPVAAAAAAETPAAETDGAEPRRVA